ncbi:unnamed protein product [Musa acuminata subsp. malaccensis]|uniref:(wild Malaysian banana) hypothetical protein n=1 Tax=Musa acuminata subsp. malaccensis TaxID=214687 RepID=A0A804I6H4_MUSAM|nr:PREDICTED: uncharacterized protein LOC103976660 [Musa acuminata subsp. malaccensis]CAG1863032.1 unnamed protein product [Musa acuminata subsp. malaccensis]
MSAAGTSGALLLCRRHRLRPPYPVVVLSRTSLPEGTATPYVPPRFPPLCMGSNPSVQFPPGEQMSHSWQPFESGTIRYLIRFSGKGLQTSKLNFIRPTSSAL